MNQLNGDARRCEIKKIPIILFSTYLFGQRLHRLYHRIWRRMAILNAILADTIPGIRVVKCFAQEAREADRFPARAVIRVR